MSAFGLQIISNNVITIHDFVFLIALQTGFFKISALSQQRHLKSEKNTKFKC